MQQRICSQGTMSLPFLLIYLEKGWSTEELGEGFAMFGGIRQSFATLGRAFRSLSLHFLISFILAKNSIFLLNLFSKSFFWERKFNFLKTLLSISFSENFFHFLENFFSKKTSENISFDIVLNFWRKIMMRTIVWIFPLSHLNMADKLFQKSFGTYPNFVLFIWKWPKAQCLPLKLSPEFKHGKPGKLVTGFYHV